MKRYYLDGLNIFQSIIKAIITNTFLTIFIIILILIANITVYLWYVYVLGVIFIVVFWINIGSSIDKKSFYIEEDAIILCSRSKEQKILIANIILIEEYFGIEYLFGKKIIILHEKNKRYNFIFKKNRANNFKEQIENIINLLIPLSEFDL